MRCPFHCRSVLFRGPLWSCATAKTIELFPLVYWPFWNFSWDSVVGVLLDCDVRLFLGPPSGSKIRPSEQSHVQHNTDPVAHSGATSKWFVTKVWSPLLQTAVIAEKRLFNDHSHRCDDYRRDGLLFYLNMIDTISGLFSPLLSIPGLTEIPSPAKRKS